MSASKADLDRDRTQPAVDAQVIAENEEAEGWLELDGAERYRRNGTVSYARRSMERREARGRRLWAARRFDRRAGRTRPP
jgi:hypothetical protein